MYEGVMNMEPLILFLAVLFLLAVSFFAIGIYLSSRSKHKDAPLREKPAPNMLDETLQEEGVREVARILRDEQSGALMLEKNGVIYRTARDMDEEQRRMLSVAASDLHSFLELKAAPQAVAADLQPPRHQQSASPRHLCLPPSSKSTKTTQNESGGCVHPRGCNRCFHHQREVQEHYSADR
jgi:hypothetical protein